MNIVKKIISFIRHSHPEIYKGILFFLAIATVVYIYPKQGKFKYEFSSLKGKPWHHEDLIAPFDFSIKKTKQELATEKQQILKDAKPYFIVDTTIIYQKKNYFREEFEKRWDVKNGNKDKSFKTGSAILDSIYAKGIIQSTSITENKPPDFSLFTMQNNIAKEYELNDFFTIQTAFNYINATLSKNEKTINTSFLLSILENSIAHNITYDETTSKKVLDQAFSEISLSRDVILKDQSVISKGEIVDAVKFQILESLKLEYEEQSGDSGSYWLILLGQILLVSLCLVVLFAFLGSFRKEIFSDNTKITFLLFLIILLVLMAHLPLNFKSLNIYILPFCILPVIIRAFYDTRVALFVHLVTILLVSFMAPNRFEFAFIQLLGGMVAIFSIVNMRKRSQIFVSAALIFLTYSIAYIGINIIQEGGSDIINALDFAWFGLSALLTIFSYPLIFIFEKIFGFISDVSLLEISDTNSKLLRELASRAPGTFQHSLQVANLAEDAIFNIGGNALLVRAGALYHDIGKMEMPMYFIENQVNGVNPHEDMNFEESASIIIGHVIKGIEIAKKHNLPEQIIDFIRTHHGTTITAYFYRSFQKAFPEEKIDEAKFHYPGPIPFSKETAVLMMADSVEAASRSLKKYDVETVDNLVEKIIDSQIQQNQFMNANITFKDINIIKKLFKKKLMNVYHIRVEYPR